MTRTLRALAAGLSLFVASGCVSSPTSRPDGASPESGRLERILESRALRVGLSGNQPPLNMRNKRGEIVGLEIDLVNELGRAMGLDVQLVVKPFADLIPALEANEVDLVISGMTITPERNARVAFAGPYMISGKSVLTKASNVGRVEDPKILDDPARTYAALAGSTSELFVTEVLPNAKLVTTPDYDGAVQMVIDGSVDALVADFPICNLSVLRFPDANLSTLATPFTAEPIGIALPSDDPLFVNLVQNYLATLENTGTLVQLKAKWFSPGAWLAELP